MGRSKDGCQQDRDISEARGNDMIADEEAMLRENPAYRGFFSERFYRELLEKIRGEGKGRHP